MSAEEVANQNAVSIEEGSDFDKGYRTLFWAVDLLDGDNPMSNSIKDHGMVDADARKFEIPEPAVYTDNQGGMNNITLNQKHDLLGLPRRLRDMLDAATIDEDRRGVLLREISQAELRIQNSLAGEVDGVQKPEFAKLWSSVTGKAPPSLDQFRGEASAIRDHMMRLLTLDGVHVSNPRTIKQHLEGWEHGQIQFGVDHQPEIKRIVTQQVTQFFNDFKSLAGRIPALAPFVADLTIANYELNVLPDMNFDAGLSYIGGVQDGQPTGAANFEWNAGRPATREDIQLISLHETVHMLNTQLMDRQRRAGKLGPESALLTMSSGRAVNEEGLAQTAMEMIHGGSVTGVVNNLGPKMGILMLQDQLQDIARIVAAVGWNHDFAHLEPEARRLAIHEMIVQTLLQTPHIGNKYGGEKKRFWREFPGGQMYAPAYHEGSRMYRDAIAQHGIESTLAVGTHSEGLVDMQAFKDKMNRKTAV